MANENLVVFPNGRHLSEFALSGTAGSITGTGTAGSLAAWQGATVLEATSGNIYSLNTANLTQVGYIEGASGTTSLRLFYPYGAGTAQILMLASRTVFNWDMHIGANSGFLRDNAGTVEMHLTSGKKFSIIWG